MGTDRPAIIPDGEAPARLVRVSEFQLQQKEVSIAEFARFVNETGYRTDAERFGWSFCFERTVAPSVLASIDKAVAVVPWWIPVSGADFLSPDGPGTGRETRWNNPVAHVSHRDATAYCEHMGMRLPREAEFEYAMRGGLENRSFPWGDVLLPGGVHRANLWQGRFPEENTAEDGHEWVSPVDSFGPQNAFGLFNIVGNVWEWVADAWVVDHGKYIPRAASGLPPAALDDPQIETKSCADAPETCERVKRGGSYMCHRSYCYRYRNPSRSHNTADSSAQNLGFRCASDVDVTGEGDDEEEEEM